MASIIRMPNGNWRALIRRAGHQSQCKTWGSKAEAERWARRVEAEMDKGKVERRIDTLTVADFIDAYQRLREQARPISDSSNEHYMLKALRRGLGHLRVSAIEPGDLVTYATMRKDEGAGPYTINMDVSKLGTVLRYAAATLKVTPPDIVGAARPLLAHLRLIGGGNKRERLPTDDELIRVVRHLRQTRGEVYGAAVIFAAMTAMRRGEVCALKKADIDQRTRTVPVWRKHPRKGKVLHRVPLIADSMEFALAQPDSEDGRIFPVEAGTLSKYFTWTCRDLGIPDLHLHDMRHEGSSRLFWEHGMDIPQAALVTGHAKWEHLKRYTQLRPEDLNKGEPTKRLPLSRIAALSTEDDEEL